MGAVQSGGVVEITNCFAVPHCDSKSEVGALDMGFHREMVQLHQKANPNEVVVGWYSTGHQIDKQSVFYHNFYWRELQQPPILLTLDTELKDKDSMDLRAYIGHPLTFSESMETSLGSSFQRLELSVHPFDSERLGLDLLLRPASSDSPLSTRTTLLSDLDSLRENFHRVLELLDDVIDYVDKVIAGTVPANPKIGRFLEKTVSALPQINPEGFHQMFNNSLQDILMVVYLANLTRTQLAISESLRQPPPQ